LEKNRQRVCAEKSLMYDEIITGLIRPTGRDDQEIFPAGGSFNKRKLKVEHKKIN
jgi:hypothetical protein